MNSSKGHKKKIVIATPWDALAHAIRCLSVAKYLFRKGFQIFLLGQKDSGLLQWSNSFANIDAESLTISSTSPGIADSKLDFYATESPLDEFRKIEQYFENIQPACVLSDAYPIMSLVCDKLHIPHASLASACWTNYYPFPRPSLKWDWVGQLLGAPVRQFIQRRLALSFEKKLAVWAEPLNSLARSLGLRRRGNILDYASGNDLTLITDIPEIGRLNNPPDNFKYCGPILWHPCFHSYDLLNSLDRSKRTIYVSFGSSGRFSLLQKIVRWLLDAGFQIVITLSGVGTCADELLAERNVRGANFINAWEVIPRCDAVLFHGGAGTAYQVLACAKPSVAIPDHLEQYWNANRLEEVGGGCMLHPGLVCERRVIGAVNKVIDDDEMQARLKEIAKKIPMDGGERAGELVLGLMR